MELLIFVWLSCGILFAIWIYSIDPSQFYTESEFEEDKFEMAYTAFLIVGGPLLAPFFIPGVLQDRKNEIEQKQINIKIQEEQKLQAKKAKLTRERKAAERAVAIPLKVEDLDECTLIIADPDSDLDEAFFERTIKVAEFFVTGKKSDLNKTQRNRLITLVRSSRLRIMNSLAESEETIAYSKKLSSLLEKIQEKCG